MSTCPVCCENIRYNVCCKSCKFNCCRVCVRTYICGQLSEPHCMNCKEKWNLNFVEESIGSSFFKTDFKKAQANTYFEFEKTQLPLIQDNIKEFLFKERNQEIITSLTNENKMKVIGKYGCISCVGSLYVSDECLNCEEEYKNKEKGLQRSNTCNYISLMSIPEKYRNLPKDVNVRSLLLNRYIDVLKTRIKCSCGNRLNIENNSKPYYKCINKICTRKYCKDCFELLNKDKSHVNGECEPMTSCPCTTYLCDICVTDINKAICSRVKYMRFNAPEGEYAEDKERRTFIMKCQVANCAGFLSTHYKCGVCDTTTCVECLEIKENDAHECKKENVDSAKMIKKETRPCPTCATRIYKIDGCDQMWCVDCKTAFSWNTGNVVNSKIHNPHYYEYIRQTQGSVPRDPDDIVMGQNVCIEFPTFQNVRNSMSKLGISNFILSHSAKNALSTESLETYYKIHNLHSILVHNITEFHRFIVEINALVPDDAGAIPLHRDELIRSRILYALKRTDIETFKRTTYMYHQKSQHHSNFIQVMLMFKQVCKDLFQYIIDIINGFIPLQKIPTQEKRYLYLLELNNKVKNIILKQLFNSITYTKSMLPVNKYYTNKCDKNYFVVKQIEFKDEELKNEINTFSDSSFESVYPAMIKWDNHVYCVQLRYISP